jgi:hypothetical protein
MEWIQPEHREIHDFLTQWGRWLKTQIIQGHCGSIEHRWRSPQCWNDPQPKLEVNEGQALLIESLMRIVPKVSRKVLKLRYVHKADPEFIIKRLRLRDYSIVIYTARQIVLNLTRHRLAPSVHGVFHNLSLSDILSRSPDRGDLHSRII